MSTNNGAPTTVSSQQAVESKLIWVMAMHRHGDRAPINMGPKDRYNNIEYWPDGFGNLDNAGRHRMYKLGQFIRKRYPRFLTDNFRESYSRSSDVDRCIESAQAVLAGLYPPTSKLNWNKNNFPWVPTPVHSVPPSDDYVLNEAGRKVIHQTVEELIKIENSPQVKELMENSAQERELLEREIAYEFDSFVKFKCAYSTLDIELRNGLEMPVWYTKDLQEKLYYFAGKAFALAGGGSERMKQLRSGHLLDDIVRRMELISATNSDLKRNASSDFHQPTNAPSATDLRKFVHYSTHDSILSAFLEALDLNGKDPIPPGFGATFFIELYIEVPMTSSQVCNKTITQNSNHHESSEKYLKLFYMDDTESEAPVEQHLPGCSLDDKGRLTLTAFKLYVKHLLPTCSNF